MFNVQLSFVIRVEGRFSSQKKDRLATARFFKIHPIGMNQMSPSTRMTKDN